MRSYQVFAQMTPERAAQVMAVLVEKSPAVYTQAVAATSAAMNARPKFLMRQAADKRANMVRRTLARVRANDLAEENDLAAEEPELTEQLHQAWLEWSKPFPVAASKREKSG